VSEVRISTLTYNNTCFCQLSYVHGDYEYTFIIVVFSKKKYIIVVYIYYASSYVFYAYSFIVCDICIHVLNIDFSYFRLN
jgi:hypothetical protein